MAKRIKRQLTEKQKQQKKLETEYKRQRTLLEKEIKSLRKRGYNIKESDVIPKEVKKPTQASIKRLKKARETAYIKATYVDTETGEIISGSKRFYQEEKEKNEERKRKRYLKKIEREIEANMEDYGDDYYKSTYTPIIDASIVDKIKEEIDTLPDNIMVFEKGRKGGRYIDLSVYRGVFLNLVDDAIYIAETSPYALEELFKYYTDNIGDLDNATTGMMHASSAGDLSKAIALAVKYLNGGKPVTASQSKTISEYGEYL